MYFMRRKRATPIRIKNAEIGIVEKLYIREFEGNFYRTYSFMDLLHLVHVRNLLRRSEEFFVPEETMLSVYEGHTFFSIFQYNPEIFDKVYE